MSALHNMDSLPPRRLGRYLLRRELASGGMARVFLSQFESDGGFKRWVAVKVVHPHLARDRRFVDMLLDEARVTSQIHHPNVCSILDFGENEGEPHIVMEYIHGLAFSSVMQFGWPDGKLPFWLSARIIADAARGLHAAHELRDGTGKPVGIVHRDVSPQNIMVHYDGVSKILDFGIARARGRIVQTGSYEVKGKFTYMSPEQLEGREVDRRADIWALAVILWEATVGKHLFRGENDGQTTLNVIAKDIPKPSDLVPGYPPELERVVMQGLSRNLDDRTQTAADFADALDAYLWTLSLRTGPTQVSRWMRNAFANQRSRREQFMQRLVPGRNTAATEDEFDEFEEMRTDAAPWVEESGSRESKSASVPITVPPRPPPPPLAAFSKAPGSLLESDVAESKGSKKLGWLVFASLLALGGVFFLLSALGETSGPPGKVIGPIATEAKIEVATEAKIEVATEAKIEELSTEPAKPKAIEPESAGIAKTTKTLVPVSDMRAQDSPKKEPAAVLKKEATTSAASKQPTTRTRSKAKPNTSTKPKATAPVRATGSLNLLAIPTGEVYLGSRRLGRTPLIGYKLPVGTHRLKVKRDGKTTTVTARVKANQTTKLVVPPDSAN